MAEVKVTKDLDNNKLVLEYIANGTLDKVWRAFTERSQFEKWWGPKGWETTTKEFNFAPGGRIHYGMKCVDESQGDWFGKTSWGLMNIQQVEEPHSFTYKDSFTDETGAINTEMPTLTATTEFSEEDGKTKIVTTNLAESPDQIEELIKMGMVEGYSDQLERLDELVA